MKLMSCSWGWRLSKSSMCSPFGFLQLSPTAILVSLWKRLKCLVLFLRIVIFFAGVTILPLQMQRSSQR